MAGLTGHTGSPAMTAIIKTAPYGSVVMANERELKSRNSTMMSTTMHELGHAWAIGWRDDKGPGQFVECYSGGSCYDWEGVIEFQDDTPERVDVAPAQPGGMLEDWSLMAETFDPKLHGGQRFAFSIEELSTIDDEDQPSIND